MWEKFKLWTRVILFGALTIYLLIVVTLNWTLRIDGQLHLMFLQYEKPRVLVVLLVTAVLSIFGWWLIRTIFKALRQFRDVRDRSRTARLEREMVEMKAKAGMLQKKENTPSPAGAFPVITKPVDPPPEGTTAD